MGEEAPHIDLELTPENYEVEFFKILEVIKPMWEPKNVVYKKSEQTVTRGLLNTMVRCYSKENKNESIMIRIHNKMMNAWIDRSAEIKCIKHLHALYDCAPKILATFVGGFCYEFIHGEILSHDRLKEEAIWRSIAEELAKIHAGKVVDGNTLVPNTNKFKEMMDKVWEGYPTELKDPAKNERFKNEIPPREVLEKEIKEAVEHAESFNPEITLTHNDTRAENIIWNEETGKAKFVDFEGIGYNYRAADIACHFERFAGLTPPDYSLLPDKELQLKWLRVYLEKNYEVTGRNKDEVTDKDLEILYVLVQKFRLAYLIAFGLGGPVFENMEMIKGNSFDIIGCSIIAVNEYFKIKEEIFALEMPK